MSRPRDAPSEQSRSHDSHERPQSMSSRVRHTAAADNGSAAAQGSHRGDYVRSHSPGRLPQQHAEPHHPQRAHGASRTAQDSGRIYDEPGGVYRRAQTAQLPRPSQSHDDEDDGAYVPENKSHWNGWLPRAAAT